MGEPDVIYEMSGVVRTHCEPCSERVGSSLDVVALRRVFYLIFIFSFWFRLFTEKGVCCLLSTKMRAYYIPYSISML